MKLQGKKVIVLGGSSGMGLATAQTAAKEGASVVIASRSKEKLEEAKKTIQGSVEALELDVAHEHKVKAFLIRSALLTI
ncbi:SDR family NAD(P)-dependent oxidoreductase [Paenibacillus larvae]|nr:SDR family NAD(P)-dependent oxidoreductase [Paenibacillus larvae]MDT2247735.1 SDR family NAD(P)-dependent oxidoreductase [Paenibacillus larvae]MDT2276588.1 SDR family NAD(P)-dependent oxidoreductase [Paenibacillus larvae]